MKRYGIFSIVFMLILSANLSAQIRYGVHLKGGVSNFIEKNYTVGNVANYYTFLPSYNLGGDIIFPFSKADSSNFRFISDFQFISGLDFGIYGAQNNVPKRWYTLPEWKGPTKWNERLYSLSVPLKLNFKFEKWVHIYGGVVNTFNVAKNKELSYKIVSLYTLNFTGGIDFLIYDRFVIGASYYRNLTHTWKYIPEDKIFYYVEQFSVKIGYVF